MLTSRSANPPEFYYDALLAMLEAHFKLEGLIHNIRSSVIHEKGDGD